MGVEVFTGVAQRTTSCTTTGRGTNPKVETTLISHDERLQTASLQTISSALLGLPPVAQKDPFWSIEAHESKDTICPLHDSLAQRRLFPCLT